jgi:hypothetical protein
MVVGAEPETHLMSGCGEGALHRDPLFAIHLVHYRLLESG